MKGLSVYVYRENALGDSTNGGISSKHDRLILVGSGIPEIFEADEDTPAVKLVKRFIGGREYIHAEPVEWKGEGEIKGIFGGNFIYTSDSRFPSDYPIPLHDRQETQEMYDRLTR